MCTWGLTHPWYWFLIQGRRFAEKEMRMEMRSFGCTRISALRPRGKTMGNQVSNCWDGLQSCLTFRNRGIWWYTVYPQHILSVAIGIRNNPMALPGTWSSQRTIHPRCHKFVLRQLEKSLRVDKTSRSSSRNILGTQVSKGIQDKWRQEGF